MTFPVFTVAGKNAPPGTKVAINPAFVTAVLFRKDGHTGIFTPDCTEGSWVVAESFARVLALLREGATGMFDETVS